VYHVVRDEAKWVMRTSCGSKRASKKVKLFEENVRATACISGQDAKAVIGIGIGIGIGISIGIQNGGERVSCSG
jgi:hypothetical protein